MTNLTDFAHFADHVIILVSTVLNDLIDWQSIKSNLGISSAAIGNYKWANFKIDSDSLSFESITFSVVANNYLKQVISKGLKIAFEQTWALDTT